MIDIVVLLKIKNQSLFQEFETQALAVLQTYNGRIITAFEPVAGEDSTSSVDEIHYLQFPTMDDFNQYRADARLENLSALRSQAIAETRVFVSETHKHYEA